MFVLKGKLKLSIFYTSKIADLFGNKVHVYGYLASPDIRSNLYPVLPIDFMKPSVWIISSMLELFRKRIWWLCEMSSLDFSKFTKNTILKVSFVLHVKTLNRYVLILSEEGLKTCTYFPFYNVSQPWFVWSILGSSSRTKRWNLDDSKFRISGSESLMNIMIRILLV